MSTICSSYRDLHGTDDQRFEPLGNARHAGARLGVLAPHDFGHHVEERFAFERLRPRRAFVQNHPERVLIRASVDELARAHLLGRHVRGRADHRARAGEIGQLTLLGDLRDAGKSTTFGTISPLRFFSKKMLSGFEISVHHAGVVGRPDPGTHRQHDVRNALRGKRPLAREQRPKALAFEKFHHQVRQTFLNAEVPSRPRRAGAECAMQVRPRAESGLEHPRGARTPGAAP